MSADGVVEHFNVAKHIAACFLPSGINLPADTLPFQQLEEAFGHGVVMAVASSAHAWLQVVASQESLPLMACKLTPLVRMNDDCLAWPSAPDGHMQGIQRQLSVDAATCCPTNDLA